MVEVTGLRERRVVVGAGVGGQPVDAVVFDRDLNALSRGLLADAGRAAAPALPRPQRSLSALPGSMLARTSGFPLVRHNVFFDDDHASEFDDIFRRRRLPERGTVHVCAQDRRDDASDPAAPERLLCLVNAPADGDTRSFDTTETQPCEERSLKLLARCGLTIDSASAQSELTTPSDFNRMFSGSGGALNGRASQG